MTEYEGKEEVELWGFTCKVTMSQMNSFKEYFRQTEEHREMYGIQDLVEAYVHKGDVDKVIELNKRMCELDLIMFRLGRLWYETHVLESVPDTLPDDL